MADVGNQLQGEGTLQYLMRQGFDPNTASSTLAGGMTGNTMPNAPTLAQNAIDRSRNPGRDFYGHNMADPSSPYYVKPISLTPPAAGSGWVGQTPGANTPGTTTSPGYQQATPGNPVGDPRFNPQGLQQGTPRVPQGRAYNGALAQTYPTIGTPGATGATGTPGQSAQTSGLSSSGNANYGGGFLTNNQWRLPRYNNG